MHAVPTELIEKELAVLAKDKAALMKYSFGRDSTDLAIIMVLEAMLEGILARAGEAAEDPLTAEEAVSWSGLQLDTLRKNYPSTGSGASRRWLRGDLPMRSLSGLSGRAGDTQASAAAEKDSPAAAAGDTPSDEEVLRRAIDESLS